MKSLNVIEEQVNIDREEHRDRRIVGIEEQQEGWKKG